MHIVHNFELTHVLPNADDVDFAVFTVMDRGLLRRCPICLTQGANFSTSRLSNALAFVSAFSWSFIVCFETLNMSSCLKVILGSIVLTWGGSLLLQCFFNSDLTGLKNLKRQSVPEKRAQKCVCWRQFKICAKRCLKKKEAKRALSVLSFAALIALICFVLCGDPKPQRKKETPTPAVFNFFIEYD